ncbi:MAG: Ribonuclease BN, partial [uncultured Rubrobacteraceae bacterium]
EGLSLGFGGHRRPRLRGAGPDQGSGERPAGARRAAYLFFPALLLPFPDLSRRAGRARAERPGGGGETPYRRVGGLPAPRGRRTGCGLPRPDAPRYGLRSPRLRDRHDALDGLGGLYLHKQGGEPGLRRRGDAPVLEATRHLRTAGFRLHAPDDDPLARGLRGGDLCSGARRSPGVPPAHLERGALGVRLRGGDGGPQRPLLPGPRRQRAVQVDHTRRLRRHGPHVRRERRFELLRLQARQLRPDLRPAGRRHRLYALALRHGPHGVGGRRDQRRPRPPRRGEEGRRARPI